MPVFTYSDTATDYLRKRDKKLGRAIDAIGRIERSVNPDLFAALVNSIIGQQISTKAQVTVWNRFREHFGAITPGTMLSADEADMQSCGISLRKVSYIKNTAREIASGALDIEALHGMSDEEVVARLSALKGIGVWTAEMLMIFSMQRPDVLSYGDLAIRRGMCMLYGHKEITRPLYERYRKRYSPHASVASLYLWAIAGGQMEKRV